MDTLNTPALFSPTVSTAMILDEISQVLSTLNSFLHRWNSIHIYIIIVHIISLQLYGILFSYIFLYRSDYIITFSGSSRFDSLEPTLLDSLSCLSIVVELLLKCMLYNLFIWDQKSVVVRSLFIRLQILQQGTQLSFIYPILESILSIPLNLASSEIVFLFPDLFHTLSEVGNNKV